MYCDDCIKKLDISEDRTDQCVMCKEWFTHKGKTIEVYSNQHEPERVLVAKYEPKTGWKTIGRYLIKVDGKWQ